MPPTRVAEELQRIINITQCRPKTHMHRVISDAPYHHTGSTHHPKSASSRGRSKNGRKVRSHHAADLSWKSNAKKMCVGGKINEHHSSDDSNIYVQYNSLLKSSKYNETIEPQEAILSEFRRQDSESNVGKESIYEVPLDSKISQSYQSQGNHGHTSMTPPMAHSHPKCPSVRARIAGRKPAYSPPPPPQDTYSLSLALGIPSSDCTREKRENRKLDVMKKLINGEQIRFSMLEEFDIHSRAESYVRAIQPDQDFCISQSMSSPTNAVINKVTGVSYVQLGREPEPEGTSRPVQKGERKRRRHSCGDIECYVVHPSLSQLNQVKHGHSFILPEGLCLLRPTTKLVELVAQGINDSPDGMLQVQQVYIALQNKYPYFQYMDKGSTTSWRSSIRHALYQKWFRKIAFSTDLINCRGCYWAINRRYHPREWTLPPNRLCPEEEMVEEQEEPEDLSIATVINAAENNIDSASSNYEPIDYHTELRSDECMDPLDLSPVGQSKSGSEQFLPRPRDPDPMLSPQDEEVSPSQEEIVKSPKSSENDSPTLSSGYVSDSSSFKLVYDEENSPVLVYEPRDLTEKDYTDSLEWICKEDTCPTTGDDVYPLLDYSSQLYTPLCISYSMPSIISSDIKNHDDLPVTIHTRPQQWFSPTP